MNSLQVKMYEQSVERINLHSDNVLYDLNALRMIANCPGDDAVDFFCSGISANLNILAKMQFTIAFIERLMKHDREKLVLASHWTSSLDKFEVLLKARNITFTRLDGSTPSQKRQGNNI
jgi:SNF2 family DNA or RNA helicase